MTYWFTWSLEFCQDLEKYKGFEKLGGNRKVVHSGKQDSLHFPKKQTAGTDQCSQFWKMMFPFQPKIIFTLLSTIFFVFKKSQGKQCNFGLQTLPRVTIRISVFKAVGGIHMQLHLMYPFRCKDWWFRLPAEDDWEDSPLKLVWGSRVHCWVLHVETLSTQTLPFVGFQFCRLRKPCQEFVF